MSAAREIMRRCRSPWPQPTDSMAVSAVWCVITNHLFETVLVLRGKESLLQLNSVWQASTSTANKNRKTGGNSDCT